jgi:hypothetical protein
VTSPPRVISTYLLHTTFKPEAPLKTRAWDNPTMSTQTAPLDPSNETPPPRSFTRMEASSTRPFVKTKAKTALDTMSLEVVAPDALPLSPEGEDADGADVFEKRGSSDSELDDDAIEDGEQLLSRSQSIPDRFDELPIELMSLTDR